MANDTGAAQAHDTNNDKRSLVERLMFTAKDARFHGYEGNAALMEEAAAAIESLSASPQVGEPVALDPQLAAFYQVDSVPALLAALEEHVEKLQESARRNVKPWEDTFPPTLLPKYLRESGLTTHAPPSGGGVRAALLREFARPDVVGASVGSRCAIEAIDRALLAAAQERQG